MSRSTLIRDVETDLHQSRARGLLKHPGRTSIDYVRYKKQRRRWMALAAIIILTAATVAAKGCVA